MASNDKMTIDDVVNALKIEEAKKLLVRAGFNIKLSGKRGPHLKMKEGNHIHDDFPQQHSINRVHSKLGESRTLSYKTLTFLPTLTPLELVQRKLLYTIKTIHRLKKKQVRKLVDTLRKVSWVKKRSDIMQLRLDNPTMTLEEMGQQVGLTRERIRQILKHNNVPTRAISKYPQRKCANCQKPLTNTQGSMLHVRASSPAISYCNTQCRQSKLYDYYPCDYCGRLVWKRKKEYKHLKTLSQTFHCSHSCSHLHQWNTDGAIRAWGNRGTKRENYHQHAGFVSRGYQLWHPSTQIHSIDLHNVNERS